MEIVAATVNTHSEGSGAANGKPKVETALLPVFKQRMATHRSGTVIWPNPSPVIKSCGEIMTIYTEVAKLQ
jgi:hypothetical protein